MRYLRLLTMLAPVVLAACTPDRTLTAPPSSGPSKTILDGANGGNRNFFFLPPLAADPSAQPNYRAGSFNGRLTPTVEVCRLASSDVQSGDGHCPSNTIVAQWGTAAVSVSIPDERYQVNWKTDSVAVDPTAVYRIRVLIGERQLGFTDVTATSKNQFGNAQTGVQVTLQPGRTLPIAFRIQNGALVSGGGANDFVERTVPATNGTDRVTIIVNGVTTTVPGTLLKTGNGQAGAFFPDRWLPPGYSNVVVTIERVPTPPGGRRCQYGAPDLVEFEGCYHFETYPTLPFRPGTQEQFYQPVTVQMCTTLPSNDPRYEALSLFKSDTNETITLLPEVDPKFFLTCDRFAPTPASSTAGLRTAQAGPLAAPLARVATTWNALAGAAWNGVTSALTPRSAYAVDLGLGGTAFSFSNIGFGIRQSVVAVGPTNLTPTPGIAGPAVTARVRVVAQHDHAANGVLTPPEYIGIAGVPVTFNVTAGGGVIPLPAPGGAGTTTTVVSDADGYAQVAWTLGAGTGNTLVARIGSTLVLPYSGSALVTFTATGSTTPVQGVTIGGRVTDNTSQVQTPPALTATLTAIDGSGRTRAVRYLPTGNFADTLYTNVPRDLAFIGQTAVLTITFTNGSGAVQTRSALVTVPQAPGTLTQSFTVGSLAATIGGVIHGPDGRTPVAGAVVQVGTGSSLSKASVAVTDARGAYMLNLQNGDEATVVPTSTFSVDAAGYLPLRDVTANMLPLRSRSVDLSLLPIDAAGTLINGLVVTASSNVGLSAVPVTVDGTTLTATTGPDGYFSLFVPRTAVAPGATLSYGPVLTSGTTTRASYPMPANTQYGTFVFPVR